MLGILIPLFKPLWKHSAGIVLYCTKVCCVRGKLRKNTDTLPNCSLAGSWQTWLSQCLLHTVPWPSPSFSLAWLTQWPPSWWLWFDTLLSVSVLSRMTLSTLRMSMLFSLRARITLLHPHSKRWSSDNCLEGSRCQRLFLLANFSNHPGLWAPWSGFSSGPLHWLFLLPVFSHLPRLYGHFLSHLILCPCWTLLWLIWKLQTFPDTQPQFLVLFSPVEFTTF